MKERGGTRGRGDGVGVNDEEEEMFIYHLKPRRQT